MGDEEIMALSSGFATVRMMIDKIADKLTEGSDGI